MLASGGRLMPHTLARRALAALLLVAATACDDDFLLPSGGDGAPVTGTGWCAVKAVFDNECTQCHSTSGQLGGLDLESDPYAAIVSQPAAADAALTLVTPGDAEASFLYLKLLSEPPAGGVMPPGSALDAATIEIVRAWIADGATQDACDGGDTRSDTDVNANAYHPEGFTDPAVHGAEAKLQTQACTDCHGATLEGNGAALSCDTCHEAGWREDCTFCHGDASTGQPAPPVHISGADDGANASFIPHLPHVEATEIKRELDCSECHVRPTDVLSAGHLFVGDTTPGAAEVDFSAGLAPVAQWNNGTCTNNYCHGNGRGNNGEIAHDATVGSCSDCHAGPNTPGAWRGMSGEHERHLDEGFACTECHNTTANAANQIIGLDVHVDGQPTLAFVSDMRRGYGTCNGTCHGEPHLGRTW
jgi:hypothetical protein